MLTETLRKKIEETIMAKQEELFTNLSVGTDGTEPTEGDLELGNEVLRKARQIEEGLIDENKILVSLWVSSVEANDNILQEIGIFDEEVNGNMWSRNLFEPTLKTDEIELWFDIQVTNNVKINEVEE